MSKLHKLPATLLLMLQIGVLTAQDPTQVIAVATRDEQTQISDIYTIQLNGENRTNLTRHPADDIWPAWSPDGTKIAFSSNRDGNYDIWVMDADGDDPTKVADLELNAYRPVWSPDSERILFVVQKGKLYDFDQTADLYVLRLVDRSITRLTDEDELSVWSGSWAPDGWRIAFASSPMADWKSPRAKLFATRIDDPTTVVKLTRNVDTFEYDPYWLTDHEIVYIHTEGGGEGGVYRLNLMSLESEFLMEWNILKAHMDVGAQCGSIVILTADLDGIFYFNAKSKVYFRIKNTGPFDDAISWKPLDDESC